MLLHRTLTFLSEISRPVREINIYLAAWQVTEGPEVTIDFERAISLPSIRKTLIASTVKRRTLMTYTQNLTLHILPTFGGEKVQRLLRGQIKALLASKLPQGLSKNTSQDHACDTPGHVESCRGRWSDSIESGGKARTATAFGGVGGHATGRN